MRLRSPKITLGGLSPKIGSKCPVDDCGIALPGYVSLAFHSFNPLRRNVVCNPCELLNGLLQVLLPSTPPIKHELKFWPGGCECFGTLWVQFSHRWTLVALVYPWERKCRYPLVDLSDIFPIYRTFLAIVRYTRVDIEWRYTSISLRWTFHLGLREDLEIIPQGGFWHLHLLGNGSL